MICPSDLNFYSELFQVIVLGPGFGEAILLKAPDTNWIIVDSYKSGGIVGPKHFLSQIKAACECVLISHPHEDHVLGIEDILDLYPEITIGIGGPFLSKNFTSELKQGAVKLSITRLLTHLEERKSNYWNLIKESTKVFGSDKSTKLTSLHPSDEDCKNYLKKKKLKRFANSIASPIRVEWKELNLLLGSDLELPSWNDVNKTHFTKKLNLLKVPHHASVNSLIDEFNHSRVEHRVATPYNRGYKLPRFDHRGGIYYLTKNNSSVYLTSLPYKYDTDLDGPLQLSRLDILNLNIPGVTTKKFDSVSEIVELSDSISSKNNSWILFEFSSNGTLQNKIFSPGTVQVTHSPRENRKIRKKKKS